MSRTIPLALASLAPLLGCGRIDFEDTPLVAGCLDGDSPAWGIAAGYRAAIVNDDALDEPSGVAFARGMFGDRVFVANHGNTTVTAIDPATGAAEIVVPALGWPTRPIAPTALVWDAGAVFDGGLYLADRGTSGDGDSAIFAIDWSGATRVFAAAGPALDDVYSLAFVDDADYGSGLMVAGDSGTASSGTWARYAADGTGVAFSDIDGVSGIAVDDSGAFGGGVFAARPSNLDSDADDTVAKISSTGVIAATLVEDRNDIHAAVLAPRGPLGRRLYAATSSTLIAIDPAGAVTTLATAVDFDPLDGNVIAVEPGGSALYVATRSRGELICIEPDADAPGQDPPPVGGGGAVGE